MNKISSVLLIDDDETTNYINKLTINRAGITDELLVSLNGRDALDLIRERCELSVKGAESCVPRLILLDINMPIMDGFGFLDALGKLESVKPHNIKVVILTTSLNPRDMERIKGAGVTELLNKPLTREALTKLIDKYFPDVPSSISSG